MSLHIFSPSLCIMKWNINFLLHCLKTEEFLPGQSYTQYHYEHLNAQNAAYCAKRTNYNHRTFICYLDVRKPSSFTLPLLPPFSLFLTSCWENWLRSFQGQSASTLRKVMVTGEEWKKDEHHSFFPGQEGRARSYRLTCLASVTGKVVQQIILKTTSEQKGQEGVCSS